MDEAQWPGLEAAALLDDKAIEATQLFNDKKHEEAAALALKILDAVPNQRAALRVLFEIRDAEKRRRAADALGARLAGLEGPAALRAQANERFAYYLIGLGRHAEAAPYAAAAVKAMPRAAAAHHIMGMVLTETGALQAGERHYRRALELLAREDGMILANLAWNLKMQGRLTEARKIYDRALALRPDNSRGVGGLAQLLFTQGARGEADAVLDDALARWPQDRLLRMLKVMADLAQGRVEAALERLGPPEAQLPPEILARGRAHMLAGQPQEAITAIATARGVQRERTGQSFRPEELSARLESYQAYFTAERIQPLPRARPGAFMPVFLLGFPRSGTGLLEQLLAQTPGFAPGDEVAPVAKLTTAIPGLAGGAAYPQALDEALIGDGAELPERLREMYEAPRRAMGLARPEVGFITDRAVSNVWHLGLIKLLYPEAPIIHVLRHPYDLLLANIAQDRRLEGDAQAGLPGLARYYDFHARMLRHYRGQLTLRYLPLRYEELVARPEEAVGRVREFIGLDAAIPEGLAGNALPVAAPWPGHFAGRVAVHGGAAWRFRAYEAALPHLFKEVEPILAPWLAELGYDGEQGA
ncbi:sulfotransferase [Acidocella sp.]|uniref:tetratricopeptide repeat-containing sulfotransferase family protein n=1 Tax=Acidocella sp. TaxID=50710 RepID=UPI0026329001|nr:sulfotransferase [Acidocella sp.]